MNKPIEETHPFYASKAYRPTQLKVLSKIFPQGLTNEQRKHLIDNLKTMEKEIQEHTVDKAVLRAFLDGYFLKDNSVAVEFIRHLKEELGL